MWETEQLFRKTQIIRAKVCCGFFFPPIIQTLVSLLFFFSLFLPVVSLDTFFFFLTARGGNSKTESAKKGTRRNRDSDRQTETDRIRREKELVGSLGHTGSTYGQAFGFWLRRAARTSSWAGASSEPCCHSGWARVSGQ